MKLIKRSQNGITYDCYYIAHYAYTADTNSVEAVLNNITLKEDGIPHIEKITLYIGENNGLPYFSNYNNLIVDPEWNENSTPPKPANFNLNDMATWDGLSASQIPFVSAKEERDIDFYYKNVTKKPIEQVLFELAIHMELITAEIDYTNSGDETKWHFED